MSACERDIRLTNPVQFLAQERTLVEDGYAGDIIGVFDPGIFLIGDTLTDGQTSVMRRCRSFRRSTSGGSS